MLVQCVSSAQIRANVCSESFARVHDKYDLGLKDFDLGLEALHLN
jgi:hypothetical protein